jgi:acetyl esterase/lipase
MLRKLSLISGFIFLISNIAVSGTRFVDSVFAEVDTVKDIQYRTATNFVGATETLLLDLYKPKNDTMQHRPLIIIIHGGSFYEGTRNDAFSSATAAYLAKKGFITASIEYRLGIDPSVFTNPSILPQQFGAATFRAIQDTKAAVRFLKTKADSQQYMIDTSKVFLCGYSAGAVTAIHYAHAQIEEIATKVDLTDLGSIETGDNLTVSSSIKGYISFAGAIFDTNWISAEDVPFVSFHGTKDTILPYAVGYVFNISTSPEIYGDYTIHTHADQLGITNKLVTYQDAGHDFVGTPGLLISSLDSAVTFLYPLLGNTSIKKQIFAQNFNKNDYLLNKNIIPDIYNLTGRKMGAGTSIPQGTYISNYRNIDNESLSAKSVFLKGK